MIIPSVLRVYMLRHSTARNTRAQKMEPLPEIASLKTREIKELKQKFKVKVQISPSRTHSGSSSASSTGRGTWLSDPALHGTRAPSLRARGPPSDLEHPRA